jgi:hypothetical protein
MFLYDEIVLQSESLVNTFIVNDGIGTHGEKIICNGKVYDGREYSNSLSTSNHFRSLVPTYTLNPVVNNYMNISFKIHNTSAIDLTKITIKDPYNDQVTVNASYLPLIGKWNYNFIPTVTGAWTIMNIYSKQKDGQSYVFKGSNDQFTVLFTPSKDNQEIWGEGIINMSNNFTINISVACGNGICQSTENPIGCWEDCKVNYNTLITCMWDEDVECNWSQNWFPNFFIMLLFGIGVFSIYQYEIRQKF